MCDRSDNTKYQQRCQTSHPKMPPEQDLGTRKTLFVLVIVVGCFAVLWPKVFYPMLVGPTNQRMKPSHLDKGCCDVISDIDINTINIMTELCYTIIENSDSKLIKTQDVIKQCQAEIYDKCGIDISAMLQEQVRLGRSFKQILDEIRSFNSSFCLKSQFGLSPSKLGIHRVTINLSPVYVKQERPSHLTPEMLHPALRERGSAIVQPYQPPVKPGHPKFVDGRPGPVPGIRPPMGGAGHMVHSPKASNSMGVIMPIYTIGIVIFFSYTLMKLLFKKKPEGPGAPLYPPVEPSITFKKEVFESPKTKPPQGPLIVNAMTALLDEVDQELEARRKSHEVDSQKEELLLNGSAKQPVEHEQPSVKILGMEMTASCEGGQKWDRCESPVMPKSQAPPEPIEPPQEIFLGGTLPAQSQLLVTDSTVEEETNSLSSSADPPIILASKMTLSVISLDAPETEDARVAEDLLDESKYATASGTTAAEYDISDEETSDIIDEIEKSPQTDDNYEEIKTFNTQIRNEQIQNDTIDSVEAVTELRSVSVDNEIDTKFENERSKDLDIISFPEIENDLNEKLENLDDNQNKETNDINNKFDENLEIEEDEELGSDVEEVENDTDENSIDDEVDVDEIEEIIIFEDEIDMQDEYPDDQVHVFISNESVQNIGDIIDEIITDGARRLEISNENLEHSTDEAQNQNDNSAIIFPRINNNSSTPFTSDLSNHNGLEIHESTDEVTRDDNLEEFESTVPKD